MIRIVLLFSALSFLLLGCTGRTERQERALQFFESATEKVDAGLEKAEGTKDNFLDAISGSTEKLRARATNMEESFKSTKESFDKVQEGMGKVTQGIEEVHEALDTK